MDPWLTGLAAIFGAQNPENAGTLLDQAGITPPPMGAGENTLGGFVTGNGGVMQPTQAPQIGPWDTTVNPAQPGAQPNPLMGLAGLQGVKAPAPITPVMTGGVAGGVKPPAVNENIAKMGNPAIQALMQALLSRGQAPAVPSLGALVRGRGQ